MLVVDRQLLQRVDAEAGLASRQLLPDLRRPLVLPFAFVLVSQVLKSAGRHLIRQAQLKGALAGEHSRFARAGTIEDSAEAEEVEARFHHTVAAAAFLHGA